MHCREGIVRAVTTAARTGQVLCARRGAKRFLGVVSFNPLNSLNEAPFNELFEGEAGETCDN